jgi:hypothetical protein
MARIISGNRTAEDIVRAHLEQKRREEAQKRSSPAPAANQSQSSSPTIQPAQVVATAKDYITLRGITCVDADGNVSEQYPVLYVKKDVERNGASHITFTPYKAATDFEKQGSFLPSMALTCNVLAALYPDRADADVKRFLLQYKNHGAGHGYQAQNTIINYATQEVIHYPSAADFNQTIAVNAGQRKAVNFVKATLKDCSLEDALKDAAHTKYVKQLTGLANPADLVEIGKYFGKPAQLWFPWTNQAGTGFNEKRAAWFGCGSNDLNLDGNNNLYGYYAARGVRLVAP